MFLLFTDPPNGNPSLKGHVYVEEIYSKSLVMSTDRTITSELRLHGLKSLTRLFSVVLPVDELFKEANVGPNGKIDYEEFTRMVTLPSVDY